MNHLVVTSLLWAIPFSGLLLSIALFPLFFADFWHKHFGKITAFWTLTLVIPFFYYYGFDTAFHEILHIILLDYIPFTIILVALFAISGGIRLQGNFMPTPTVNTAFLTFGTIIASWIGTTGAAMLLIRPLIATNKNRRYKTHIIVFFVFLVANIGGSLTPLGDPPLFLGFLNGIDFFWTTRYMFAPMLLIASILLVLFWLVDTAYYRLEESLPPKPVEHKHKLRIDGTQNFLLLLGVILTVLISGFVDLGKVTFLGVDIDVIRILSVLSMIALTLISLKWTEKAIRQENEFNWFPMQEVAKLFFGIFITIIPVIAYLKTHTAMMAPLFSLLPEDASYFWLTGLFSAFLDNAPTYLIFFNIAGGADVLLANPTTLLAISAGAVFMGALTLIGNAPNFLVFAVARAQHVKTPTFLGYMLWSVPILFPLFALVTWIWFV